MNNTATILIFALWICAVLYLFWPEIQEIFKPKKYFQINGNEKSPDDFWIVTMMKFNDEHSAVVIKAEKIAVNKAQEGQR